MMSEDQLFEDVKAAHAVFDLCGIRKTNRGTTSLTLRMRALMLAAQAGVNLTQDQVSAEMRKSTSANLPNSN